MMMSVNSAHNSFCTQQLLAASLHRHQSLNPNLAEFPFLEPTRYLFNCVYPECKQTFRLTNDLYNHIRDHSSELECPLCQIRFKCMATLVYHVRTHTGAKPYVCPLPKCKFVTATKGNLKAHLLSNQHKDVMSLRLLNTILSLDTEHGRPEIQLHAPRERKKKRTSQNILPGNQAFDNLPPAKKRRSTWSTSSTRSSAMSLDIPNQMNMIATYPDLLPNTAAGLTPLAINPLVPITPYQAFTPFMPPFTPLPITPNFKTSQFYQSQAPVSARPINLFQPVNNNGIDNMETVSCTPATKLPNKCSKFESFSQQQLNDKCHDDNNLTVRVKIALLKAVQDEDEIKNINNLNDADHFLMAMDDGIQSTGSFYQIQSRFNLSRTQSPPPLIIDDDDEDKSIFLAPPLVFD